jgi:hypothetical protein
MASSLEFFLVDQGGTRPARSVTSASRMLKPATGVTFLDGPATGNRKTREIDAVFARAVELWLEALASARTLRSWRSPSNAGLRVNARALIGHSPNSCRSCGTKSKDAIWMMK